MYKELEDASLQQQELELLDEELKLLSNAENIKLQLSNIYFEMQESEQPIVQQLKSIINKLQGIQQYHTGIEDLNKRLQSIQLELSDIGDELETINDAVQYSPERIQIVNDRILMGYKLLKKHQVQTTGELLAIKDSLAEKIKDIIQISDSIAQKQKQLDMLLTECEKKAMLISSNRHKILPSFEANVNELLGKVGMPNACFKVSVAVTQLYEHGIDSIDFLFNANLPLDKKAVIELIEPLRKVASGGELSRIMLCVKSLVAKKLQLPTLIFDEIDTGISGEAAKQVGEIMKSLSTSHQVISITHQPQIAAKATAHYFVYKAMQGSKISTSIRALGTEERIEAIAKMLSGEKPTAAALENAREMVLN